MGLSNTPEGKLFIAEAERNHEAFDPRHEPLRALRDLIGMCEALGLEADDLLGAITLANAQDALAELRGRLGDYSEADANAYGPLAADALLAQRLPGLRR